MLKQLADFFKGPIALPATNAVTTTSGSGGAAFGAMQSFYDLLLNSEWGYLTAYQAIQYYQKIAPLGTAVDMLSDELATLNPLLYDDVNNEFEKNDPVYNLLKKPNPITERDLFFRQYASFYLITGNAYIVATGLPDRPPLELYIIPPQFVTIEGADDGLPMTYRVGANGAAQVLYSRKETIDGFRFMDSTGRRELYHVKDFNPNMTTNNLYGQSRLASVYMELEQHYASSRHNLSLLKKGARLSGLLSSQGPLTDDQYVRIQSQIEQFWKGPDNAGRIMLGEGGLDFKEMSTNNRDMDFRALKQDVTSQIYTRLKIPLALISPDHMTMSNMDSARLNLYDMSVLPLTDRLYSELTKFLRPRYNWDDNLIFRYDQESIPALQARRNDELKTKKQTGVLKIDEIRKLMGYDPLEEGGDVLYQPNNQVPVTGELPVPGGVALPVEANGGSAPSPGRIGGPKKKYFDMMRAQRDAKGSRLFNDEQILALVAAQDLE